MKIHVLGLVWAFIGLCGISSYVSGENILFFNGLASFSHVEAMEPLANNLAVRGHNVTYLTPLISATKHPKVIHYCPQEVLELQSQLSADTSSILQSRFESKFSNIFFQSPFLWDGNFDICSSYYKSPGFKSWIRRSKFDLVVVDASAKECGLPLSYIFKAKLILFAPHTVLQFDGDTHGWPSDPMGVLPFDQSPYGLPDSFQVEWDQLRWYFWKRFSFAPRFDELVRKELGVPEMPSVIELERETALFMVNNHYTHEFARSLPPFVIPVGGLHCRFKKELEDGTAVKDFIQDARSDGFVYVSFGSFLQGASMSQGFIQMLLDTFGQFPKLKFVWKFERELTRGSSLNVPGNVLLQKWLPQQDLLGHRLCKGYIMQGGLMSLQQSIFHAVPVIIIPFAGDQPLNARTAAAHGHGIPLEPSELTQERLQSAIQELVYTDKYSARVKEMSKQFKDRPQPPLDAAVWWTEYVIRNKDFSNMKPLGLSATWWQRRMLHFWALVASAVLLLAFSICFVFVQVEKRLLRLSSITGASQRKAKKNK